MDEHSHIEDFFRKRLASQEFAYQEDDWLKLERKLELSGLSGNTALVRSPVKLVIIILAGLTAAFILGWMTNEMVTKNNKSDILKTGVPSENQPQKSATPSGKPEPATKKNAINKNQPNANASMENAGALEENDGALNEYTGTNDDALKGNVGHDLSAEAVLINDSFTVTTPIQNSDSVDFSENIDTASMAVIQTKVVWNMDRLPYKEIDLLFADNSNPFEIPVGAAPTGSSVHPFSRFSIGLAIAPDFNSTGLLHHKSMSPAVGGVLTYTLSPRWSVSAKVFYNNKKYRSSGDYYNVSYDYWKNRTNGVVPDVIDGSCRVIDVPVMLNYAFLQKGRLSFSASAGLGSYFLLDEKYKFTFNANNPGAATEWSTTENSRVVFSVVNFALGMSLRTGPRTSMVMEPYLKIPLKHMGWANVNLSGMGLTVLFNYHL